MVLKFISFEDGGDKVGESVTLSVGRITRISSANSDVNIVGWNVGFRRMCESLRGTKVACVWQHREREREREKARG